MDYVLYVAGALLVAGEVSQVARRTHKIEKIGLCGVGLVLLERSFSFVEAYSGCLDSKQYSCLMGLMAFNDASGVLFVLFKKKANSLFTYFIGRFFLILCCLSVYQAMFNLAVLFLFVNAGQVLYWVFQERKTRRAKEYLIVMWVIVAKVYGSSETLALRVSYLTGMDYVYAGGLLVLIYVKARLGPVNNREEKSSSNSVLKV